MKPLFIFLTLSLVAINTNAQNEKQSIDFVRAVFHEKNIRYLDSLGYQRINEMKSFFDDQFKGKFFKTLRISEAEKYYIDHQLTLLKYFSWKTGLFENSTLVGLDTIERLSYKIDSAGRKRFYSCHDTIYGLSKPIFLRNNTVCFFYQERDLGSMCGDSGHFFVYIKRKHGWILWGAVYDWVS